MGRCATKLRIRQFGDKNTMNAPHPPYIPRSGPNWLLPATLAVVFAAVLGVLLTAIYSDSADQRRRALRTDSINANESLLRNLNGNRDYFLLLAKDMAAERLDAEIFQERVSQYVADNPELINVAWADKDFVIRWTAPYEPNKQIVGLTLSLPEPERASHQAQSNRAPAYTRVFEVIRGNAAFEIYAPIFRGDKFLGTFGGVYAVNNVLAHALPPALAESYHVTFLNSGVRVAELPRTGAVDDHISETIPLEYPGFGAALLLVAYSPQGQPIIIWLSILVLALALGMVWGMWLLARDAQRRRAAEKALYQEKERAQVTLHSIADAVITTDAAGVVQYINPIAQRLTGWTAEEAQGHPITVVFNIVDERDRGPISSPVARCLDGGGVVGLGAPCVRVVVAFNEAVKDESKIHSVVQTASG